MGASNRDPRVDRAMTWILTTALSVAFSLGAWQLRSMYTAQEAIGDRIGAVGAKIDAVAREISELHQRVSVVEAQQARLQRLEQRVDRHDEVILRIVERGPK